MNPKNVIIRIALFILFCLSHQALIGKTIYVNLDASGNGTGFNWFNAVTDLQQAINFANSGDIIRVAEGTYVKAYNPQVNTPYFLINKNIQIYGGYNSYGQRDIKLYPTILSAQVTAGSRQNHVMYIDGTTNAISDYCRLDGITFQDGLADGGIKSGGGLYIDHASPTIINCTFRNNEASERGGSMAIYSGSPKITNCYFYNNKADLGGAIFAQSATVDMQNCIFHNNAATGEGGAMFVLFGSHNIDNSTFYNDLPNNKCFIHASSSTYNLNNSILYSKTNISECITAPDNHVANLIGTDPLFLGAPAGDFRLLSGSPAINAGDNASIPSGITQDFIGNPRIMDGTVDIGAHEGFSDICGSDGDQSRMNQNYFYDQRLSTQNGTWSHETSSVSLSASLLLTSDEAIEFGADFEVEAGATLVAEIATCEDLSIQTRLDYGVHPYQILLDGHPTDSLIGKRTQGGIIFYMDAEGSGMIAMPEDQSFPSGTSWGCLGTSIGTSSAIGAGEANTREIVQNCSDSPIAAKVCADLNANGYDDWFLPSSLELKEMYDKIGPGATGANDDIGGFANTTYISSTENNANVCSTIQFWNSGSTGTTFKSQTVIKIRAARSFSVIPFYLDLGVSYPTMIDSSLATLEELIAEGVTFEQLLNGGISLTDILNLGYTIQDLLDGGVQPSTLINAGAQLSEFYNLTYAGGVIFHIAADGTGLVAAPDDSPSTLQWGCNNFLVSGALGTAIGTGSSNTAAISNACTNIVGAAVYCSDLDMDGYDDWFLPSSGELLEMYDKIRTGNNFTSGFYWSSTQTGGFSTQAVVVDFSNGSSGSLSKNIQYNVRAVRAF